MRTGPADTDVLLFARRVGPRSAGGTRAVLARATLCAELGYRTTLVVTGLLGDDERWVRSSGLLHPDVAIRTLWRDGPRTSDRERARQQEPLVVPRIADGPGVTRRRRVVDGQQRIRTFVDGRARTVEVIDPATEQTTELICLADDGTRQSRWQFVDGTLAAIVRPDRDGRRDYVVDGRAVWLQADAGGTEGTGAAQLTLREDEVGDFAGAVAHWLDDEFAASDRLIVFADGENSWQRTLRRMRHPGLRGVSVLHNSHLTEPYDASAPTKPHWEGFFSDTTNVDVMVCLTERQHRHLLDRYPGLPLRVLRHAVPQPATETVPRDPRSIVFLGRFAPQKQLDHLLRAFALVSARVGDAHLDMYGYGPDEESLRRLAHDLAIDVRFHGTTSEPLRAFAGSRVAAMTSHHEGLPLTLTEAMSVGTPFVAYDCNYGPAEVITDGRNGFLLEQGDVAGVADRLARVLTDDRLARRLGRRAQQVTRTFSERRYRRGWSRLLSELT